MRQVSAEPRLSDPLTLIAGTWLACGCVLLGLTPLPWHDTTFGWAPAFWLLAAPCLLLMARAWCARQGQASSNAVLHGHRDRLARSNAYPMPMASRVRPRAQSRMAVVTPRTTEACLRPVHPRTARPARRVG